MGGIIMEKIVIMVLITLTMGQAKDDFDTMKVMMAEMKSEMMAELASTKDDLAITKDELAISKADHAITRARTDELEREVALLRAPPFIHACGSYSVYWDTSAYLDSEEYVDIYLQKNGGTIQESHHHSSYRGPSGYVYDQGGRTIVVYLGVGDTLQLYRDYYNTGEIESTTFCVSLTTPDT